LPSIGKAQKETPLVFGEPKINSFRNKFTHNRIFDYNKSYSVQEDFDNKHKKNTLQNIGSPTEMNNYQKVIDKVKVKFNINLNAHSGQIKKGESLVNQGAKSVIFIFIK